MPAHARGAGDGGQQVPRRRHMLYRPVAHACDIASGTSGQAHLQICNYGGQESRVGEEG